MIRILSLCAGLCGAGAVSQYPEFAQQYTQRLAGQVDALSKVVADFDTSALDAGLTRTQALDQMTGTEFLDARQSDMRETFTRHTVLTATLADLRNASALGRIQLIHRLNDMQTLQKTWADFQPAVPVTASGAVTGGVGFVGGWTITAFLLSLLKLPFGRKRRPKPEPTRREPQIQRPASQTFHTPRLMGETRP
jgi:hypothetical protein